MWPKTFAQYGRSLTSVNQRLLNIPRACLKIKGSHALSQMTENNSAAILMMKVIVSF